MSYGHSDLSICFSTRWRMSWIRGSLFFSTSPLLIDPNALSVQSGIALSSSYNSCWTQRCISFRTSIFTYGNRMRLASIFDIIPRTTFGSGNSIFAAHAMGRSAIGIEKDKTFYDAAVARQPAAPARHENTIRKFSSPLGRVDGLAQIVTVLYFPSL